MMNLLRVMPLIVIAAALLPGASAARALAADSPMPQAATKPSTEEILVTASGFGSDPSSAKLDATREAIRQAVGTFIDVKSVVDGDQLVSDRILSATSALVIGSKVVAGPTRRGDGTYEVKCEVKIRKQNLVGALSDAGFKVTGAMDGDAAKRVSEINFANAKEAEAILKDRLSNLWSKLMIGRLLDDNGVPLGAGELPTVVRRDDGMVVVCANVQLYFHLEAYYTKFVPDMKLLLEALAVSKSDFMLNRSSFVAGQDVPPPQSRFGKIPIQRGVLVAWQLSREPARQTIWMSDGRDETGLNEHFLGFELPVAAIAPFQKCKEQIRAAAYRVELLDGNGRVVVAKRNPVLETQFMALRQVANQNDSDIRTASAIEALYTGEVMQWLGFWGFSGSAQMCLSPRFSPNVEAAGEFQRGAVSPNEHWDPFNRSVTCDVLETRVDIVLSASDLAQIKSYRIVPEEGIPWK